MTSSALTPRLMTRAEAARYCGVSPASFSGWVRAGRMPPAISGTARWDRAAIDRALDRASGLTQTAAIADPDAVLAQWLAAHENRP